MNIGDIVAYLKLEMKDFTNGLDKAQDALQDTASDIENTTSNMSNNIKALVVQNLGQIGQQVGQMGKSILSAYGEMIQVTRDWSAQVEQQKFVFNNLDKAVQKGITTNTKLADELGMTEQQYLNNATAIAAYFENAGIASDVIAAQIPKVTQLTADMSAMADVPIDQAVSDFKSALMGNFEVMDKYNVSMNVATINNSEYAKSLGKTWDKMTEAEKQMAILNEMYRQTADYTGLAQEEADSFGKSWDELKQKMMETVYTIGSQLLPVLQPLVEKISEAVESVAKWVEEHPKLTQVILVVIGVLGVLMTIIGALTPIITAVAAAFMAFGTAALVAGGWIALIIAAIVALIAAGVLLWQNWDTIKAKAQEVWASVTHWFQETFRVTDEQMAQFKENWSNAWEQIKLICQGFLDILLGIITLDFGRIKDGAGQIWDALVEWIKLGWENLKLCFEVAMNFIKEKFWEWVNGLSEDAQNLIKGWLENFQTAWESIKQIFEGALQVIKGIWNGDWNEVSEGGKKIWEGIKSWFKAAWENLKEVCKLALDKIKEWVSNKFQEAKEKLVSKVTEMKDKAKTKFNEMKDAIINAIKELPGKISDKFQEIKQKVVDKINELKTQAKEKMKQVGTDMVNAIKELPSKLRQAAKDAVQGLINGLNDKLQEVKNKAKEIADKVKEALTNALKIKSPSRVMRDEVGKFIPEGIAVGMDMNADSAINSAEDLAKSVAQSVNLQPLRASVTSTGIGSGNSSYSSGLSADARAIINQLAIMTGVLTEQGTGVEINIDTLNNHTDNDVNTLMQKMAAQIKLNNLGKGRR